MEKKSSEGHQNAQISRGDVTFQIKEEQLDIAKKWIQTGEVKAYREEFSEEKTFTVPVKREELVIEKKSFKPDNQGSEDMPAEVIRIPLSEERVDISKQKVPLEDVSIYRQPIKDVKHIEETLKKEEFKVKTTGSPKVIDESNPKQF